MGAVAHPALRQDAICVQVFKPYAEGLERAGFEVHTDMPQGTYSLALVLIPKNQREAEYDLARAARVLPSDGLLVCAADNKAGGTRLEGMLEKLGFSGIHALSKNKARVVWGKKSQETGAMQPWLEAGAVQPIEGGAYQSRPGLFSWDRLDKGSALLLKYMPESFSGRGADFGCGYGALSRAVLKSGAVETVWCADADARALECCRLNLRDERAAMLWADLTKIQPALSGLDFIVMNPPFHEGKTESAVIGQAFIETAAAALKPGGAIWMVANTHLPYETILKTRFSDIEKLHEGGGFKVFKAVAAGPNRRNSARPG